MNANSPAILIPRALRSSRQAASTGIGAPSYRAHSYSRCMAALNLYAMPFLLPLCCNSSRSSATRCRTSRSTSTSSIASPSWPSTRIGVHKLSSVGRGGRDCFIVHNLCLEMLFWMRKNYMGEQSIF